MVLKLYQKMQTTGAITEEAIYSTRPTFRQTVDNTTLNTGSDVTTTLTRAQSGTLFEIDGTGDIVVNMPALSTENNGSYIRVYCYYCCRWK